MAKREVILVTGGAGYIGSHACKGLFHAGFQPIVYDNLENGHQWAVKWGPLEIGDISDQEKLSKVLRTYKPSSVLHFAAHAYVGESVVDPAKYYRNNVASTITLLDAMKYAGIRQMVFSSTCATYGIPEKNPVDETTSQNPINPYGRSKMMIENILDDYQKAYGMNYVSLRYFNAAGADPDGEIGERHNPETHLIPLILDACLGRISEISIFGDDYNTPDGSCIRDYIHVTDLADAHLRALNLIAHEQCSDVINLGTGKGYSVKEVVDTVRRVTKCKIRIRITKRRPGDPPILVSSSQKAFEKLGWEPKNSVLETIVQTAWDWHKHF